MGGEAVRHLLVFIFCALAAGISCTSRHDNPAPSGVASSAPDAAAVPDARAATADCDTDVDCAPLNCCYALEDTSCIPRGRAHCEGFTIECVDFTGPRFACACVRGRCVGNAVSGTSSASDAAVSAGPSIASGALKTSAVLDVIVKHGRDVRACHALARNSSGTSTVRWNVLPAGKVEKPLLGMNTMPSAIATCLVKKIGAWRFPKAKGATHVTYPFRFSP